MDKKTIEKVDRKVRRVFIRADFNVPLDENGNITDDGRPLDAADDTSRPRRRRQSDTRVASRSSQGKTEPEVQSGSSGAAVKPPSE